MKRWIYTATLLVAYVLLFRWWAGIPAVWVAQVTGPLVAAAFGAWMWWLLQRRTAAPMFLGPTDAGIHALVLLDIVLEGVLVPQYLHTCADGFCPIALAGQAMHSNLALVNGLPCALSFVAVIVPYRFYLLWRARRPVANAGAPPPPAPTPPDDDDAE